MERRLQLAKEVWALPQVRRDVLYILGKPEITLYNKKFPLLLDRSSLLDSLRPRYEDLHMEQYLRMLSGFVVPTRLHLYLGLVRTLDLRGSLPLCTRHTSFSDLVAIFPNIQRITTSSVELIRLPSTTSSPSFRLITTIRSPCTSNDHSLSKAVEHHLPSSWVIEERQRFIMSCPAISHHYNCFKSGAVVPDFSGRHIISIKLECSSMQAADILVALIAAVNNTGSGLVFEVTSCASTYQFRDRFMEDLDDISIRALTTLRLSSVKNEPLPTLPDVLTNMPWDDLTMLQHLHVEVSADRCYHYHPKGNLMHVEDAAERDVLHALNRDKWRREMILSGRNPVTIPKNDYPLNRFCAENHRFFAPDDDSLPIPQLSQPLPRLRGFSIGFRVVDPIYAAFPFKRLSELAQRVIAIGGHHCEYSISFSSDERAEAVSECNVLNNVLCPMFKAEVQMALARDDGTVGWRKLDRKACRAEDAST